MKKIRKVMAALFLFSICLWGPASVYAADSEKEQTQAMQKLIDVLYKKGTLDKSSYDTLTAAVADSKPTTPVKVQDTSLPKIDTNGKFQVTSNDGNFSFRVGGRLHLDGTVYKNDDKTDLNNAFDVRRARLEFQGSMYKNWDWKLDYEFGQVSEVKSGFRDAFVRFRVPDSTSSITIGQFKEYFGLEHQNSSNDFAFVERALPSRAFHDIAEASDGRRIGVGWNTNDRDSLTFALGAFGRNVSGDSADNVGDPFAVESRLTYSPVHTANRAIHTALNANWIDLNDPARGKLSSRPEARLGSQPLIGTGDISNAQSFSRYATELGAVEGPAWVQGEYLVGVFDRSNGDPSVTVAGWHADFGYVLTGESRVYDFERGAFKTPKVAKSLDQGGYGAWEFAARLSALDYNDADIQGGSESNVSTSLNWYPNDNFRFMLTWTKILDINGGEFDGQNPSGLLLRTQFAF